VDNVPNLPRFLRNIYTNIFFPNTHKKWFSIAKITCNVKAIVQRHYIWKRTSEIGDVAWAVECACLASTSWVQIPVLLSETQRTTSGWFFLFVCFFETGLIRYPRLTQTSQSSGCWDYRHEQLYHCGWFLNKNPIHNTIITLLSSSFKIYTPLQSLGGCSVPPSLVPWYNGKFRIGVMV
jgi:hypothetical protein